MLNLLSYIGKSSNKRQHLDSNALNNYRAVSNLSYLSKIIDRAIVIRLNKYLLASNLIKSRQSAHRTALIRVRNDIMMPIEKGVIQIHLDLCAAFDKVHHYVPFCQLEKMFGLWIKCLSGFGHIWKNVPKECQFRVPYPMYSACFVASHRDQSLAPLFSQCKRDVWRHTVVRVTGCWEWIWSSIIIGEFGTLHCWHYAMDDPKSAKAEWS